MSTSNQTYKELAIPHFKETFDCIDEVIRAFNIPYYLIGVSAIALELLKEGIKPVSGTKDIDFAVMISSMSEYENISKALENRGFHRVSAPWTFYSDKFKVIVDLLPFGEIEEHNTVNFDERQIDLHMLGFQEVMEEAVQVNIGEKIANIPPLQGMVILKLIAWSDRPEKRGDDLPDIVQIIRHYFDLAWDEIVEFHYDTLEHEPFDQMLIAAEVLGRKCKLFLEKSKAISNRVLQVLDANLEEPSKSEISKVWARNLATDVEYAFSLLRAFRRGIDHP